MTNRAEEKQIARTSVKRYINSINRDKISNDVHLLNNEVLRQIRLYLGTLENKKIAAYIPDKYEVSINPLLQELLNNEAHVYIPIVNKLGMLFHKVDANLEIIKNEFLTNVASSDFDLVLVPLVALTKSNRRIGRGGGHYDRFFINTNSRTQYWSILFSKKQIVNIKHDEWDVRINRCFILDDREVGVK